MVKVSSVGYYHEWLVMQSLQSKLPLATFNQDIESKCVELKHKYSVTLPAEQPKDASKFLEAVAHSEFSAPHLADKIIHDLHDHPQDDLIITHVGAVGLGKGNAQDGGKADLIVQTKSGSTLINASLKIAKDGWITLLTTAQAGLINKLFYPDTKFPQSMKGWNYAVDLISEIDGFDHIADQLNLSKFNQSFLSNDKSDAKSAKDKALVNEITKSMIKPINEISHIIFGDLFDHFYKANKAQINANYLKALGLDTADDVYYTLIDSKTGKFYFMSSNTSPTYKQIFADLKGDFTLNFSFGNDDSATVHTTITNESGVEFWNSVTQFQQSGNGSYKLFMHDITQLVETNNEDSAFM